MKILFDTHAFLWWDSAPEKLSARALQACQQPENTLWLSVASIWELQIKAQLGKLKLPLPLAEWITGQLAHNRIEVLPIELPHVLAVEHLPHHHKDPFDRLLVAQANAENALLLTQDPLLARYPCQVWW